MNILSIATNDIPASVEAVCNAMECIYEPGSKYQKGKVLMMKRCPETTIQGHLWEKDESWEKRKRLISIIDEVNVWSGQGMLGMETSGQRQTWRMQFNIDIGANIL